MRKIIIAVVLFILVGLQIQSCKDCEPVPGSVNTIQTSFYYYDSLIQNNSRIALTVTYDEISALSTDSIFYDDTNVSSSFSFILSNLENSTSYTFLDSMGNVDTLQVNYTTQVVVDGPDCGIREVYQDITIGQTTFDSVNVLKDMLELGDELHLEIFN